LWRYLLAVVVSQVRHCDAEVEQVLQVPVQAMQSLLVPTVV
jgi:hypothetical protein